jgi:hypothetical protein
VECIGRRLLRDAVLGTPKLCPCCRIGELLAAAQIPVLRHILKAEDVDSEYLIMFCSRYAAPHKWRDLAPWSALVLKLGSVNQETDDEEEPVQR